MIRTLTLAAAVALTAGVAFAGDPVDTFADEATVGVNATAQAILAQEAQSEDGYIGFGANTVETAAPVSTKSPSVAGLEVAYKNAVENNDRAQAAYLAEKLGL